jgi:hypothetical protein
VRLPIFNFEHEVTSAEAKHDKLEVEIEGRFFGNPDEASSFVDHLGWPPLTDDQVSRWVTALRSYGPKRVSVQWYSSDTDAREFYKSLKKVGKELNWNMAGYEPMDSIEPGLTVASRPDDPAALTIQKLLTDYSGKTPKWSPDNYDVGVVNLKIGDRVAQPSSSTNAPQTRPASMILMLPCLPSSPPQSQVKP